MAKPVKKNKEAESQMEDHDEEAAGGSSENTLVKEATPDVREIEIKGTRYRIGAAVTLGEHEAIVVDERALKSSANAGVTDGTYPIVSVTLKPGNRLAYRALVGDLLYPIRGFGTAGEVVSKIRGENKESRKSRKSQAAKPVSHAMGESFTLTDAADEILRDYLTLRNEDDADAVLSQLVETHLGPEVAKLKATQEAINKLPMDLLSALAGASEDKRQKILELLK